MVVPVSLELARVARRAQDLVASYAHPELLPEHFLLSLLFYGDSSAARLLWRIGVDSGQIAQVVREAIPPKGAGPDTTAPIRFARGTQAALLDAHHAANGIQPESEHLLVGILKHLDMGLATRLREEFGLSPESLLMGMATDSNQHGE